MSHHYPGPNFAFPQGDARLNFADLFVFPNPGDAGKSIFILTAHPSDGLNPKGPTATEPFATDALYELMIDTNADYVVDISYSVRFTASGGGRYVATVRRIDGTNSNRTGDDGVVVVEGARVSTERETRVTSSGEYRFFAGWRSDPFFFDTLGAINNLKWTGKDFFAEKNVCCIALELPNSKLGSGDLRLWARVVDGASGSWAQVDRGARASQEPFLAGDEKIAYITGEPAKDARFIPLFAHSLQHAGGYTPEGATLAAATLLPDVMPYQPGRPASYPSNGRTLTDDAAAHFLTVLTNGKVTGDGLQPHSDLLAEFPFVGPPHNVT